MGKEKFKYSKRKIKKKKQLGLLRTILSSKPYKLPKSDELSCPNVFMRDEQSLHSCC